MSRSKKKKKKKRLKRDQRMAVEGRAWGSSGKILINKQGIGYGSSGCISSRYIVVSSSSIHRVIKNSIVVGAY